MKDKRISDADRKDGEIIQNSTNNIIIREFQTKIDERLYYLKLTRG